MDIVKKSKESDSLQNDSSRQDFLRETIKTLNQRIKSLEQYKTLCELRVRDFYPNHPFPIKEEHLGTNSPVISELQQAKQKISKLESQMIQRSLSACDISDIRDQPSIQSKYNELIKEKVHLEESLRAEMLNCEEQRTYIELLKQTLEEKSEERNGSGFEHINIKERADGKPRSLEEKREIANMKNIILDQKSKIERLENYAKAKDEELLKAVNERNEIEEHLRQAAETLQIAEDETNKAEVEKNSLLEYIEEHNEKEQEMMKEMNEMANLFEEMKENHEISVKKLDEVIETKDSYEKEIELLHAELKKSALLIKELQTSAGLLRTKLDEKEKGLAKLKEEKNVISIKNESLLANITTLNETLKETQQEGEVFQQSIEKLKKSVTLKEESLFKQQSESAISSQELEKVKEKLKATEIENSNINKVRAELEKSLKTEKQTLQDLRLKLNSLDERLKESETERRSLLDDEKLLKSENSRLYQAEKEFIELKEEYLGLQYKEKVQCETIEDLRRKNNEYTTEIDRMYTDIQRFQTEISKKDQELELRMKKIAQINGICSNLQEENRLLENLLQEVKDDFKGFKEVITKDKDILDEKLKDHQDQQEKYKDELGYLTSQLHLKENSISSYQDAIEQLKSEINHLQSLNTKSLTDRLQIIECIISNFSLFPLHPATQALCESPITQNFRHSFDNLYTDSQTLDLIKFIESSADYLKFLLKFAADKQEDLLNKDYELTMTLNRLEALNEETCLYKQELHSLTFQVDSLVKENSKLKSSTKELDSKTHQVNLLKSEIESLSSLNHKLKSTLDYSMTENQNLKMASEITRSALKSQEQQNKMLLTEKGELEDMFTMKYARNSSSDKEMYRESLRVQSELQQLERERLNIECQLLKMKSEPRSSDPGLLRDLTNSLKFCQRQIGNLKQYMQSVQEEVSRSETPLRYRINRSSQSILNHSDLSYQQTPPRRERSPFN